MHLAALVEQRPRNAAHQAPVPTAVDKAPVLGVQRGCEVLGRGGEFGVCAGPGSAEDGYSEFFFHGHGSYSSGGGGKGGRGSVFRAESKDLNEGGRGGMY